MIFRVPVLAGLFLAAGLTASIVAQEPAKLTLDEMNAAAVTDRLSFPVPGELFAAMQKHEKVDWSAQFRTPISAVYTNRAQIAMNLGGLIADGYLAVEAQDGQQVKNIARDIKNLSKALGVERDLLVRANSITEFAEKGQWEVLKEELEAAQNEVTNAMVDHHDQELVTLVLLGGWVRGTQIISTHLSEHFQPEATKLLRQPKIVTHFVQKIAVMPKRVIDNDLMEKVRKALFDLEKAVSFPREATVTIEDVKKISDIAATLSNTIATKE